MEIRSDDVFHRPGRCNPSLIFDRYASKDKYWLLSYIQVSAIAASLIKIKEMHRLIACYLSQFVFRCE